MNFLIKYKFVNEDLELINEDGHRIDLDGHLINESGQKIKYVKGKEVILQDNVSKPFLDEDGNPVKVE